MVIRNEFGEGINLSLRTFMSNTSLCLKFISCLLYDFTFLTVVGNELKEFNDHIEVNGMIFNKPFVEKVIFMIRYTIMDLSI